MWVAGEQEIKGGVIGGVGEVRGEGVGVLDVIT